MSDGQQSPLADPTFQYENPEIGKIMAGKSGGNNSGGSSNTEFDTDLPVTVGPTEEHDFRTYLTPEQQQELIQMFTTQPEAYDPEEEIIQGYEEALTSLDAVDVPEVGDPRAQAALAEALQIAKLALERELGYAMIASDLRGAYYDDARYKLDKQIRSNYEERGVYETTALGIDRVEAAAGLSRNQMYNDIDALTNLNRTIASTQMGAADQTYSSQWGTVQDEYSNALEWLEKRIGAYGGLRPEDGLYSDDITPSIFESGWG